MKLTRQARTRGLTLVELLVTVVLLTGVIGAGTRAIVTARHIAARDAVMTQLFAAAQTQIARLCAADWATLVEGERALTPEELAGLGLTVTPDLTGSVAVSAVSGLELREIRVRIEWAAIAGPARAELATWRGKEMP